jgi:hypothetical protein
MTTLSDLRALVRATVPDETAWPDETLDRWIGEAIRLYSAQFPRRLRYLLELTTGTQAYPLPCGHGFMGIVSVEYPAGRTPPCFLYPAAPWSAIFGVGGPVYAVRAPSAEATGPETPAEAEGQAGTLLLAPPVATGESAAVEVLAPHAVPAPGEDEAAVTLTEGHYQAVVAFCEFASHWELETDEAAGVSASSIVLSQLGDEARRAWNRYKDVMDRLTWLGATTGRMAEIPSWGDIGL